LLKGFREGRYQVLIATDVAARGLDIPEVDLVIQCSPPKASVFRNNIDVVHLYLCHILEFIYTQLQSSGL